MQIPEVDRQMLDELSREELYSYIAMQIRNIWRVDGLYFLGIERRRGTDEATEVDAECWRYMGKVEARELKEFLGVSEPDPAGVLRLLRHTSWALSHQLKDFGVEPDGTAWFTVTECRTQLIRIKKGLGPHPCRQVREGYLVEFARECNPKVVVECVSCPPDRVREDVWCEWRFKWAEES